MAANDNSRYVTCELDDLNLFDQVINTPQHQQQQQPQLSPINNGIMGGPLSEDYDPTLLLQQFAGTSSPYTTAAAACNNNDSNNNNNRHNQYQMSNHSYRHHQQPHHPLHHQANASAAQQLINNIAQQQQQQAAQQHQHHQQQQQQQQQQQHQHTHTLRTPPYQQQQLAYRGHNQQRSLNNNNNNNNSSNSNSNNSTNPTAIPPYGLVNSHGAPNPALIRTNVQQQLAAFQQQQQQIQRQQQQQRAARAALIAADYEPHNLHSSCTTSLPMDALTTMFGGNSSNSCSNNNIAGGTSCSPSSNSNNNNSHLVHNNNSNNQNKINNNTNDVPVPLPLPPPQAPSREATPPPPQWLEELSITVSGLSLEPMKGSVVMERLRAKIKDVTARFLPCVDFLVACQQDLRKGLMFATQKRLIRRAYRDTLTPKQFYQKYILHLPQRFLMSNRHVMAANHLRDAFDELQNLSAQARNAERQDCEAMKNIFLGGMKDGESWGLRKWLSKYGGALQICTDLELILSACQKLDKEADSTKKLAGLMRPMAKKALEKLKSGVPQSYQEVSTAHPYLPFFHRLEAALRSMSNFDPEDDDVICLDDSDDDSVHEVDPPPKKKAAAGSASASKPVAMKRQHSSQGSADRSDRHAKANFQTSSLTKMIPVARLVANDNDDDHHHDDSDSDSDIEVIGVKPAAGNKTTGDGSVSSLDTANWNCSGCSTENAAGVPICGGCKMSRDFMNDLMKFPAFEDVMNVKTGLSDNEDDDASDVIRGFDFGDNSSDGKKLTNDVLKGLEPPAQKARAVPSHSDAMQMASDLDSLADVFEIGQHANIRPRNAPVQAGVFWDGPRYGNALRIFSQLLRMPESVHFLEPVDTTESQYQYPPYLSVIKNPLCFRDICASLIPENFNNLDFDSGRDGILNVEGLSFWNMWCGEDLLQALDLVLLNSLAYGKVSAALRSPQRSETNRLRKTLWNGINEIIQAQFGTNKELIKQHSPTKRGETSGFVIHKNSCR